MSENISHIGVIEKVEGSTVHVKIVQQSACSECHAQSMCCASESKDKIIDIQDSSGIFQAGEKVMIYGQSSMGLLAVLLAFVIPILIVVTAIALGTSREWDDTVTGLSGLLLLVPYYYILYLLRNKLKKRFVFTLKKLN